MVLSSPPYEDGSEDLFARAEVAAVGGEPSVQRSPPLVRLPAAEVVASAGELPGAEVVAAVGAEVVASAGDPPVALLVWR
jgi:hypothetical protein